MTNEDLIRNLKDSKEDVNTAIDKLNDVLCFLALQDEENEEMRHQLTNVAYGVEMMKEISLYIKEFE